MRNLFMNPNDGRLRSGWRILSFLFLFIFLSFIGQMIVKAIFGGVPKTSPYLRNSIVILIAAIAASIAVPVVRRFLDKKTLVSLGLKMNFRSIKDILFGFLLSGIMVAVFFIILTSANLVEIVGYNMEPTSNDQGQLSGLASRLAVISLGSVIFFLFMDMVVSWWEELVFRGYLLQNMIEGMNLPLAVILSCLLYGLVHFTNPNAGLLSTMIIVLFGYLRIYGYLLTSQLWLSFGMHMGWNFFQGHIFGFAASGQDTPSLILLKQHGPDWLSGGAFGPEGSILIIPIIGLAILAMKWWGGRR